MAHQTPNSGSGFDIFINHRGPDVKKTFASHLRNHFELCKLRAFLDMDALQAGEIVTSQIEGAIKGASVNVAIFSPKYAESPYCLNELLLMLDSRAPIIPVFFHVKPAQLRRMHGRERWFARLLRKFPGRTGGNDGAFAEGLRKLEKRMTLDAQTGKMRREYESSTIEKWRQALSRVAGISGLELEQCNG